MNAPNFLLVQEPWAAQSPQSAQEPFSPCLLVILEYCLGSLTQLRHLVLWGFLGAAFSFLGAAFLGALVDLAKSVTAFSATFWYCLLRRSLCSRSFSALSARIASVLARR